MTASADVPARARGSAAPAPATALRPACGCPLHARRLFTAGLLAGAVGPVLARDGVPVTENSRFTKLVPAESVEKAAAQQYLQLQREASQKRVLVGSEDPQLQRLRAIAQRLVPHSHAWNPRARSWKWEVSLIDSKELNAFCMPGGKIAFYTGILQQLQLDDDEVAMVMGHEMAHALREHAREQMGKRLATRGAIEIGAALLGLGNAGRTVADLGGQLLSLRFGRDDESDADLVGMDLAAHAGYNPRAGVTLWQKMAAASKGAPPQWLSTHPSGPTRIRDIETNLPRVEPVYARAEKPAQRFSPPAAR